MRARAVPYTIFLQHFPAPQGDLRVSSAHSLLTPYNIALCSLCLHFNGFTASEYKWYHKHKQNNIMGCPVGHYKGNSVGNKGLIQNIYTLVLPEIHNLQLLVVFPSLLSILQTAIAESWINPPVPLQTKKEALRFKKNACRGLSDRAQDLIWMRREADIRWRSSG